jgi:hypothetical protein
LLCSIWVFEEVIELAFTSSSIHFFKGVNDAWVFKEVNLQKLYGLLKNLKTLPE